MTWKLRKYCCELCQNGLFMFSSRNFRLSCLIFMSLYISYTYHVLYLCFYFVYGMREYSNFIDLHVTALISQLNLLNRLSFLHCIFLPLLSYIN